VVKIRFLLQRVHELSAAIRF